MSSLAKRLAVYFRNHVAAEISLSPVPTSAQEADYIYQCFSSLAIVEAFKISRDKSRFGMYGSNLTVLLNLSAQSALSPDLDQPIQLNKNEHPEQAVRRQAALVEQLLRLLGLARYSYIEGDRDYWERGATVQFRTSLTKEGLRHLNMYELSDTSAASPFVLVKNKDLDLRELSDYRRRLRHNFQKFHKFDSMSIHNGADAVNLVLGKKKL